MLYNENKNIVQQVQSFLFHCTTANVSCTICTILYTLGSRLGAPSLRRHCCSYTQPQAGLLVLLCINLCPEAPPSCRLHHCCAARAEPPSWSAPAWCQRSGLRTAAETGVGGWDRNAPLSISALLLSVQLSRQLCQRQCRSPAVAAAPARWLQHLPNRSWW